MIRVIEIAIKNAFGLVDTPKPTRVSKKPQIRKVSLPDMYILIQTVSETVVFDFIKESHGKRAGYKLTVSKSEIKPNNLQLLALRLREAYNEVSQKSGCKTLEKTGL